NAYTSRALERRTHDGCNGGYQADAYHRLVEAAAPIQAAHPGQPGHAVQVQPRPQDADPGAVSRSLLADPRPGTSCRPVHEEDGLYPCHHLAKPDVCLW